MADRPTGGDSPPDPSRPPAANLVDSALALATRGWPVFPCNPDNKQPLLKARRGDDGKPIRGTGGVSAASTDAAQIRAWWVKWPKAMIGLACGHHQLFALDFDPRHDDDTGEEWTLERLKSETEEQIGCALPSTLAARTPSGGVHLYLRVADGGEMIGNRGNLPAHVDVRGLGGYIIAPPSVMSDGRPYRWLRGAADAAIAEAPAELLTVLRARGRQPESRQASTDRRESTTAALTGDDRIRRYALAALDGIVRDIGGAGSGNRNEALNRGAFAAGQLVAAGALSATMARAAVLEAGHANAGRDPASQIEATFDSGWQAGLQQPKDFSDMLRDDLAPRPTRQRRSHDKPASSRAGEAGHGGQGPGAGDDEAALDRKCAFLPHTDLGNLERFLERHGRDFLFVEQWGWLAWDGKRWNRDRAVPLMGRAVQRTMRAIQAEAKLIKDSGFKDDVPGGMDYIALQTKLKTLLFSDTIKAWGRTSESAGHIGCIPKLAESRLSVRPQDFDAQPLAINVANGTLRFTRGAEKGDRASVALTPHDRGDLMTKIAEVTFDPAATCPRFDAFLGEVQPEAEMRDFLDCWAGYNALGLADAQKMAVFYGTGSNGKGVWINTHAHILGDYAWAAAIETFIDQGKYRKGSDASPDLAALAGRRMVYANEPEEGSKFSDGLIKAMTSDEPIGGVRELNKSPFELLVTFTNTVSANNRPRIGTDYGIQRRMQLVPWDETIPDDRADPQLKNKLKTESAGIFNRMVRGAIAYLTSGLPQPEAVRTATREYLEENDLLGQFVALCVEKAPGQTMGATALGDLFAAWQTWSNNLPQSGKPWSLKFLRGQMEKKGFVILKSSTMQWQDLAGRYDPGDFATQDDKGHWRAVTTPLPPPRGIHFAAAPGPSIDDFDDDYFP